jgi:hypothetical protein
VSRICRNSTPFAGVRLTDSGCYERTGAVTDGYSYVRVRGRRIGAHRLVWMNFRGPIPPDRMILHRCDNRRCIRLDHLFLGTAADNSADMVAKGRSTRCNKPGEGNSNARLTEQQVDAIRERWQRAEQRWGLQTAMAREYDVHPNTISLIVRGQLWTKKKGEQEIDPVPSRVAAGGT